MTRSDLPTGTVTFFFTDIEGSTRLLKAVGEDSFARYLEEHHSIMRRALEMNNGVEIRTEGDAFFAVFASAPDAARAAIDAQSRLQAQQWPSETEMRVRMGLHTGTAHLGGDNYLGLDVHRAARIADAAHGGQILMSNVTTGLVAPFADEGWSIDDLGEFRLRDIGAERLFQLGAEGLLTDFASPRSVGSVGSNLPRGLAEFIGRESEIAQISSLVAPGAVVTLTGPGGTGKTRLALEVAHRVSGSYRDSARLVSLSATADPELLAITILKALELQTSSTQIKPDDHLISFLADKEMLLLLDNFEHLLGAQRLVADIHVECPSVGLIVTSRVPLRVQGEREVKVPPMETSIGEGPFSEADRLFVERAKAIRPGFEPSPSEFRAIRELTTKLDGLPLAIELAASRLKVLSVGQILERLNNQLLSSRAGELPDRQKTIDTAIQWSYDLLTEPGKRLFERMSVFVGGAGLEEIDRVCRAESESDIDVLDNLGELIDHSLIREVVSHGSTRFSMLHVVREFAYARLAERSEEARYRGRHSSVFGDIIDEARSEFQTSTRIKWLDRLSADHDNIRAALDWAVDSGDAEGALRMVAGMWRYWQTRGPLPEAQNRVAQALAIEGDFPVMRAHALEAAGGIAYWRGNLGEMAEPYAEAVEILREHGEPSELALALYNLSFGMAANKDYRAAENALSESMAISEEIGDLHGIARVHWGRFDLAWYQEKVEDALQFARLAIEAFEQLDAPYDLGWAHFALGDTLLKKGDLAGARTFLSMGIAPFAEASDLPALILFLGDFSALEHKCENKPKAARLAGAVQAIREKIGLNLFDTVYWDQPHKEVRGLFGDIKPSEEADFALGHSMQPADAVAYALAEGAE